MSNVAQALLNNGIRFWPANPPARRTWYVMTKMTFGPTQN